MQQELQNKLTLTLSNLLDNYITEEVEKRLNERYEELVTTINDVIKNIGNNCLSKIRELNDALHEVYMYGIDNIKNSSLCDVESELDTLESDMGDYEDLALEITDNLEEIVEDLKSALFEDNEVIHIDLSDLEED